ncbi:MAG: FAD-dependent oxidoreductase [Acidobacteriota bacterium]
MNPSVPSSVDVLVVGAGIYGAAATYEASRRGLSVLLIDRGDFGAGTSQNSLKIAHGGLRYLKDLDPARSRESIEERRRLLQIAPHLVHPLRCRMHTAGMSWFARVLLRGGLLANDWLTRGCNRDVPPPNHLPRSSYPCWFDARIEDTERLLLGFIDAAEHLGKGRCWARNYTRMEEYVHDGNRVVGARLSGLSKVTAGTVIDCTGVSRSGQPAAFSMNLVVGPLPLVDSGEAVAMKHPKDERHVFAVPWRASTLIGTYDREYPHDPSEPLRFDAAWIDEFLDWLQPVHPDLARLTRADIRLVHFGLLPLDRPGDRHPGRRFIVHEEENGVIRVIGVKYTTARGVSSLAVQRAAVRLGRDPMPDASHIPLPRLRDHRQLVRAYIGSHARLGTRLSRRLPDVPFGAVAYAVEREQARTLTDVLFRRLGLAQAGHPGPERVGAVATALQELLGWSNAERYDQIEAFNQDPHFVPART